MEEKNLQITGLALSRLGVSGHVLGCALLEARGVIESYAEVEGSFDQLVRVNMRILLKSTDVEDRYATKAQNRDLRVRLARPSFWYLNDMIPSDLPICDSCFLACQSAPPATSLSCHHSGSSWYSCMD
jgi:hypothetical protein